MDTATLWKMSENLASLDLFAAKLAREIAYEGPEGCSAARLWELAGTALSGEGAPPVAGAALRFTLAAVRALAAQGALTLQEQLGGEAEAERCAQLRCARVRCFV